MERLREDRGDRRRPLSPRLFQLAAVSARVVPARHGGFHDGHGAARGFHRGLPRPAHAASASASCARSPAAAPTASSSTTIMPSRPGCSFRLGCSGATSRRGSARFSARRNRRGSTSSSTAAATARPSSRTSAPPARRSSIRFSRKSWTSPGSRANSPAGWPSTAASRPSARCRSGPPPTCARRPRRCIALFRDRGGYILAAAHAIQRDVPLENVLALVDAAREG